MQKCKISLLRQGFTLIELLIVIVIVSLIYALGFSNIQLHKQKPKALTPLNLKTVIRHAKWFHGEASLLCVNQCKTCYIRQGENQTLQKYHNGINLTNLKTYTLDSQDNLISMEYGRFMDQKICLIINFYKNGSSTQVILEDNNQTYFLPAYFGKAKIFHSPQEAQNYWIENSHLLTDRGDYY